MWKESSQLSPRIAHLINNIPVTSESNVPGVTWTDKSTEFAAALYYLMSTKLSALHFPLQAQTPTSTLWKFCQPKSVNLVNKDLMRPISQTFAGENNPCRGWDGFAIHVDSTNYLLVYWLQKIKKKKTPWVCKSGGARWLTDRQQTTTRPWSSDSNDSSFQCSKQWASLAQDAKLCLWLEKDNNLLGQEEVSKRM